MTQVYRITKKVLNTGRTEIVAEAEKIDDLRQQWDKYVYRWGGYWDVLFAPLTTDLRGTIARSSIARISMSREEKDERTVGSEWYGPIR